MDVLPKGRCSVADLKHASFDSLLDMIIFVFGKFIQFVKCHGVCNVSLMIEMKSKVITF